MTMTAWVRTMFDIGSLSEVEVQEHALIVRNPDNQQRRFPNMSLKMHSFAACVIAKPYVVAHPYKKMLDILRKAVSQGKATLASHLHQIPGTFKAFGSSIILQNDYKLKDIWMSIRSS